MKKDRDIEKLFQQDKIAFQINAEKKNLTVTFLQKTVESKEVIPRASFGEIIKSQFQFMDKRITFLQLFIFVLLIMIYRKMGTKLSSTELYLLGTISASMFSGILVISCMTEEKNNIAELAASCFFNNRQVCAVRMILNGGINLIGLSVMIIYTGSLIRTDLFQVGIYLMVPYLLAGCIHFLVMLVLKERTGATAIGVSGILMILYGSISVLFPELYTETAIGVWIAGFIIFVFIYGAEIFAILRQMERGERLCMN